MNSLRRQSAGNGETGVRHFIPRYQIPSRYDLQNPSLLLLRWISSFITVRTCVSTTSPVSEPFVNRSRQTRENATGRGRTSICVCDFSDETTSFACTFIVMTTIIRTIKSYVNSSIVSRYRAVNKHVIVRYTFRDFRRDLNEIFSWYSVIIDGRKKTQYVLDRRSTPAANSEWKTIFLIQIKKIIWLIGRAYYC